MRIGHEDLTNYTKDRLRSEQRGGTPADHWHLSGQRRQGLGRIPYRGRCLGERVIRY